MRVWEIAKETGKSSRFLIENYLQGYSPLSVVPDDEARIVLKKLEKTTRNVSRETSEEFYRLDRIDKEDATYSLIIGERSNGKTYSVLERILDNYLKTGEQGALIRRWDEDFKRGRGQRMYEGVVNAGKLADKIWDGIEFKSGAFVLYRYDETGEKKIYDREPFCFTFALTNMEHDKSTSYENVTTILFDEFLDRKGYLPDEFVIFMNVISTIVRRRDNVKIYMCANTVNKHSPYWTEMGLKHVVKQKQGTIDVYQYGDSDLKVAVEYCNPAVQSKPSDKYFAFDNPKLQMITGGAWEVAVYPQLPVKYKPKDIRFRYFIIWEVDILECDIIRIDSRTMFTYIHKKTTPIQDEDRDLIFTPMSDPRRNWRRRISVPQDEKGKRIWQFFTEDRVYYQDADVGEIVRAYLQFSQQSDIIKQ